MDSEDKLANLRVASFSYYLNPKEQENFVKRIGGLVENHSIPLDNTPFSRIESSPVKPLRAHLRDSQESFVFKVKEAIMDAKPPLVSPATRPTHVERLKSTDGEIDIFGADKYFNMKLESGARTKPEKIKEEQLVRVDPVNRSNSKQETRSIISEASTWSSGIALLHSFPKSTSQTKPKRTTGRRFSFGCTGPCLEKGSVYVNKSPKSARIQQNTSEIYQPKLKTADTFVFPILHPEKPNLTLDLKILDHQKLVDLRKSLDVFGSDTMKKNDIAKNLESKLSMLTWDAIPKTSSLTATSVVTTTTICDDMASDASSDLFEIENISASCGGYHKMMSSGSMDDASGCMTPTTLYAPSEASIEWSVMTASGADFSSAFSDYDPKNVGISGDSIFLNAKNPMQNYTGLSKQAPKSRPAGILGCKSQKCVSVAETVHKTKVERY